MTIYLQPQVSYKLTKNEPKIKIMKVETKAEKAERRRKIYDELKKFHGSLTKIAKKTGRYITYVSRVLRQVEGCDNTEIWEAAVEVLLELKEEKAKKEAKIAEMAERALAIQ